MPEVVPREAESFEKTLKRFRRKVQTAGIISDVKKRRAAQSPGEKRRSKHRAAMARARKKARRSDLRRLEQ